MHGLTTAKLHGKKWLFGISEVTSIIISRINLINPSNLVAQRISFDRGEKFCWRVTQNFRIFFHQIEKQGLKVPQYPTRSSLSSIFVSPMLVCWEWFCFSCLYQSFRSWVLALHRWILLFVPSNQIPFKLDY